MLPRQKLTIENLFNILPSGVVSKKDIGERRMAVSMLLWRLREPKNVPWASIRNTIRKKKDCNVPRLAYKPRSTALEVWKENQFIIFYQNIHLYYNLYTANSTEKDISCIFDALRTYCYSLLNTIAIACNNAHAWLYVI